MKLRVKREVTDNDEHDLVESLKGSMRGYDPVVPPSTYWPNMIATVNRRIDAATSGKGLSLSWAARVAIPGVVAIISFYIGLHYYVPEGTHAATPIAPVLASLTQTEMDSLLTSDTTEDAAHTLPFALTSDDAVQYVLVTEPLMMVESFSDEQVEQLLHTLTTHNNL